MNHPRILKMWHEAYPGYNNLKYQNDTCPYCKLGVILRRKQEKTLVSSDRLKVILKLKNQSKCQSQKFKSGALSSHIYRKGRKSEGKTVYLMISSIYSLNWICVWCWLSWGFRIWAWKPCSWCQLLALARMRRHSRKIFLSTCRPLSTNVLLLASTANYVETETTQGHQTSIKMNFYEDTCPFVTKIIWFCVSTVISPRHGFVYQQVTIPRNDFKN